MKVELDKETWEVRFHSEKGEDAGGKTAVRRIVKRDGSIERYDRQRIAAAISAAVRAVRKQDDPELAERLTDRVEERLTEVMTGRHANSAPAVEEIQDTVENVLIEAQEADIAKAYILYRARHESLRDTRSLLLDINETMDGYLSRSDWRVKENANVNFSLGGLILHNSGTLTANYWLKNVYPQEIADAHRSADFHIHDLSMLSGYCAGWSLRQLITEGLGGVPDKITSAPARHLSTLVQQMVNFLGIMQNEWAGAQALSSFDTYLAPFVRSDGLTYEEVKQCIQTFIFGVNTPSRWGCQAPFTNITLDWTVPADLADRPAIVGGEECSFIYRECQEEMNMINRAFLELMLAGDAEGRGFQYPIPTYNLTEEFDWDSENGRLLFEMTAKYGTPYFQNFINSDLDPGDVRSMCCRLQLDKRELRKRGGGLFGSDEFTGSIGVVTINLPRLGYLSSSRREFYRRLTELMDLAAQSLVIKRKVIQRLLEAGLFPYTRRYLRHLNNHFSTIGIVGMNECLRNFVDRDISSDEGREFTEEVLDYMRGHLADLQEETGDLFNLEATPAESTSYRLAKHDVEHYPDIITSGETEPYYTNSTQLPVDYTPDVFEALDHQDSLQTKYTGGTVFHAFLGEAVSDWKTCRRMVQAVARNYRLPYFTISPTFSVCPDHGYLSGEHFTCPYCGAEAEVYSRIVGYYRSVRNWNRGKKEEYGLRRPFAQPQLEERAASAGSAEEGARHASDPDVAGAGDIGADGTEGGVADTDGNGAGDPGAGDPGAGEAGTGKAGAAESGSAPAGERFAAGELFTAVPGSHPRAAVQAAETAREHARAESPQNQAGTAPASYLLFTRRACPNCPPVRAYLEELAEELPLCGEFVDVDAEAGMETARSYGVMAAPTAIFFDRFGGEIARACSRGEIEALGLAGDRREE
jgi:ribonucleoside-triphosphate reductase